MNLFSSNMVTIHFYLMWIKQILNSPLKMSVLAVCSWHKISLLNSSWRPEWIWFERRSGVFPTDFWVELSGWETHKCWIWVAQQRLSWQHDGRLKRLPHTHARQAKPSQPADRPAASLPTRPATDGMGVGWRKMGILLSSWQILLTHFE